MMVPFKSAFQPQTPASQAVVVGLEAMVNAVFRCSPVANGPLERVMAMGALIGAELAAVPAQDRDHAEAMILAAIRGAARGTEDARFAQAEPAGRA